MTTRKNYAMHASISTEDKLRALRRTNAILGAGYTIDMAQRRVKHNIDDMRKWALELNFPLITTKKSKYRVA
jgi:hypothetical protein